MYRKLILLLLVLFSNMTYLYFASETESLTAQQEEVKAEVDKVNEKIMDYEDQINEINDEIESNKEKIKKLEEKKADKQVQITDSQANLTATMQLLQRMNNTNTISTYFYSDQTEENNYFLKLDNINTVFDTISQDLGVYIEEIKDLDEQQQEIEKIKKQNTAKKKKLNNAIEKQREIEDNLKQELSDLDDEIAKTLTISGGDVSSSKTAIMSQAGISSSDYQYVDYIVNKESGWNSTAANPTSSAYGICQSLPGSKMASAGSDWQTNPVTQMKWCNSYAVDRYGSWGAAYNFWISNNWW